MKKLNYLFFQKKHEIGTKKTPLPAPQTQKNRKFHFFSTQGNKKYTYISTSFFQKNQKIPKTREIKKRGSGGDFRVSDVFFDPPQIEHFRPSDRTQTSTLPNSTQTDSNENTNFKNKIKLFQNIPNPSNTHHAHKKYFQPRNINFSKLKNKYFQTKKFLSKTLDRENTLKTQKK